MQECSLSRHRGQSATRGRRIAVCAGMAHITRADRRAKQMPRSARQLLRSRACFTESPRPILRVSCCASSRPPGPVPSLVQRRAVPASPPAPAVAAPVERSSLSPTPDWTPAPPTHNRRMPPRRPSRVKAPVVVGRAEALPRFPMQGVNHACPADWSMRETAGSRRREQSSVSSRNRTRRPKAALAAEDRAE